jgi:hypothetical protein
MSLQIDGELDLDRRSELLRHVRGCSACRNLFSERAFLEETLKAALALPVDPPDFMVDRVMAALHREPYRPTAAKSSAPRYRLQPSLVSAALASVVGMAFVWTLGMQPQRTPDDSNPSPPAPVLRSEAAVARKTAKAVSSPAHRSIALLPVDSPENPSSARVTPPPNRRAARPSTPKIAGRLLPQTVRTATAKAAPPPMEVSPSENATPARLADAKVNPPQKPSDFSPKTPALSDKFPNGASDAKLRQVSGIALVRSDDTDWSHVSPDLSLRVDQRLRSGKDSQVLLTMGEVELRMNAETEMIPIRSPQPDSPYWVVRLLHGEIFAKVPRDGAGLRILTVAGDAVSKGGEFAVRTNELFETRLLIAQGSAALENDLGRSPGLRNMQIASRLGGAPDPAQPIFDPGTFHWAYAPLQLQDFPLPDD